MVSRDRQNNSRRETRIKNYITGNAYVRVCVLMADFILLNLLLSFAYTFSFVELPAFYKENPRETIVLMNVGMLVAQYFFHTIIDRRFLKPRQFIVNVLKLSVTQVFVSSMMLRLLCSGNGMFTFTLDFFIAEYVLLLVSRIGEFEFLKYLRRKGRNSRSVLFVGNDPALITLYNNIIEVPSVGFNVLGYYADKRMKNEPTGLKWLGDIATLNRMMAKWNDDVMYEPNIDELFCSLSHAEEKEIESIVYTCDRKVIHFFYVPRAFEDYELRLSPIRVGDYIYYSTRQEPLMMSGNRFVKRLFDVCFSSVVCLFLLPVTLIVGFIIKLQSPGPIFFRQARTGIDGKTFYLYKFRSMHVNKEADMEQATKDDPRKFPFGNFMRKTNIDELPQFFNVLKGDMSIVGPRPHMLHHTELYAKLIDKYMVRLFCKPGITGWAQVTGYRGETKELWQMEGRVKRDIWYVEHWSMSLDLKIIFMTIKSIFIPDKNAY